MSDESTAVLRGQLARALAGDADARRRLLELTRDRLTRHARTLLHGRYARLEPFAQTDDVVQQLYLKILQNQDRCLRRARRRSPEAAAGARPDPAVAVGHRLRAEPGGPVHPGVAAARGFPLEGNMKSYGEWKAGREIKETKRNTVQETNYRIIVGQTAGMAERTT